MTASTTAKKTSTATKAAAPKAAKPAAKTAVAAKPVVPAPKVVAPTAAVDQAVAAKAKSATLKMKDLIAQVTEAAGGKKKGVKEIVEATLAALGAALSKGDAINLPGFGRARVAHAEDKGAGKPMTIKLKTQGTAAAKKPGKQGLADAEDEV
ncbi:MAG: HU family DNA-binding protein [Paracoccaceae bacterium]